MKILSLFDGMSCGIVAFIESKLKIDRYVAYEVDKYAIQTSTHNFPNVEQKGDVFNADFTEYEGFDFLIGGSPCTYWSIAQTKNRETEASGLGWELFSQYVRALREAKPKYFLYENNKSMSKQIRESISQTFGFEPICINSALVSAQNRQRLYWCGIRQKDGSYRKANIEQPEDKGILLKDILETGNALFDKGYTLSASYYKGAGSDIPRKIGGKNQYGDRAMVAEPINVTTDGKARTLISQYDKQSRENFIGSKGFGSSGVAEPVCVAQRGRYPDNPKSRVPGLPTEQMYEAREDEKTNTLTTVQKDNMVAEPIRVGTMPSPDGTLKGGQYMRIYSPEGKAVTINTGKSKTGSYAEKLPECFRVKEATKQGYTEIKVGGVC